MEKTTNELKGKRVLILLQRRWGASIGIELARRLQQEGCKIAALTLKPSTDKHVRMQSDVHFDMIINNDAVMEDPEGYLAGDRYTTEEICAALGVDTIWPIVITLRNYVRTYDEKYYYSYLQKFPDEETLIFVQAVYKYIKKFFDEFKPDAIVALNFVTLPHIMFNLYGAKKGVPMIAVTDCKVKGLYIFSESYRDDKGAFYDRVDELNQGKSQSENKEKAKAYIAEFRHEFKRPEYTFSSEDRSFWKTVKHHLKPLAEIFWFYRYSGANRVKRLGVTIDYRPPRTILRDYFAHMRNKHFVDHFAYAPLEKTEKYAFFPLQFQPESNIDAISPFYNNQLDLARMFALALPGDYTLVVKEHPAMAGLRSPSFYKKLTRTPNIRLIDYRISSEEVLRGAGIVLSISGTPISEAAFLCKPAIQVGDLGTTQKLPNVVKHTDMTTLSSKVKEVLAMPCGGEDYERKLENFVAAAYDVGFPVGYYANWDMSQVDFNDIWERYRDELLRSLYGRKIQ